MKINVRVMNKIKFSVLCLIFAGLMACNTNKPGSNSSEVGMFKVSVMYPGGEGKTFDMDYYEKKHMPMMAQILGKNLKFYEVDKGISGRTPNDQPMYVAMCHFYCYDIAEYNSAIAQNIDTIRSDIKNYTNIQPIVQISKVTQLSGGE